MGRVPALPGCVTQGETIAELQTNLSEAVQLWFETGDDVPSNYAAQVWVIDV